MAKKRKSYLKSIAADIDIGYNKLTREETFEVIENSHQVALLGVLERMNKEEVNQKDATGFTKLHWACITNNPLVVAALLKIPNIEVNARNNFRYTPLMLAAAGCCVHSLKLLLEDPRVDLNVANSDGVPLDKLIGTECYPCSCSNEFKKKQTQLLQIIIDKEKEARVASSNRGPKDVSKGVLRRGMKTKVGSSNRGQKDVSKGVLRKTKVGSSNSGQKNVLKDVVRKGKKRNINAFSNDSDNEKDIKKKRMAEGDLGLSFSDNEEKFNSKTEHDTRVKIEDNHHAVKNCKKLKAKIKHKNLSDITSVEPVPFKEETFVTDFKTEYIETDVKKEDEKYDSSVMTEHIETDVKIKDEKDDISAKPKYIETDVKIDDEKDDSSVKPEYIETDVKIEDEKDDSSVMSERIETDVKIEDEKGDSSVVTERIETDVKIEDEKGDSSVKNERFSDLVSSDKFLKTDDIQSVSTETDLKTKCFESHFKTGKVDTDMKKEFFIKTDIQIHSFEIAVKKGLKENYINKDVKTKYNEENSKMERFGEKLNMNYNVKLEELNEDENNEIKLRLGEKKEVESNYSDFVQLKRNKSSKTTSKRAVNNESESDLSFDVKSINASKKINSGRPKGQVSYTAMEGEEDKRIYTSEKTYHCEQCPKTFSTADHLNRHNKIHSGEKPYQCLVCTKSFSESSRLNVHQRTHTGEKTYHCEQCPKTFSEAGQLNRHNKIHSGEKPHLCLVCTKSFSQSSNLKLHQRTHTGEKPYHCKQCTKMFSSSSDLSKHNKSHTGEKPYHCKQCSKMFSSSSDLSRHNNSHTGEKPYHCKQCSKMFSSSRDLSRHNKSHTGEKPYHCKQCTKSFSQSSNLSRHKKIHTGDKPPQ